MSFSGKQYMFLNLMPQPTDKAGTAHEFVHESSHRLGISCLSDFLTLKDDMGDGVMLHQAHRQFSTLAWGKRHLDTCAGSNLLIWSVVNATASKALAVLIS
jgi:hypothetical protein